MDEFYLDSSPLDGTVALYDSQGNLIEQFYGRDALQQACYAVEQRVLALRSTLNPEDMNVYINAFYRRNRPRLHMKRLQIRHKTEPDNSRLRRLMLKVGDDFFRDESDDMEFDESYFGDFSSTDDDLSEPYFKEDAVELVPTEELDDEE